MHCITLPTLAAAALGAFVASCNHPLDDVIPPPAPPIRVEPGVQIVAVGATPGFSLLFTNDNGKPTKVAGAVSWSSSNEDALTVDGDGTARAIAPGFATLTATSQMVSATAEVMVTPSPVASITLSPESVMLLFGAKASVTAVATLAAPAGEPTHADVTAYVDFRSSDPSVITVEKGLVACVGWGTAEVTATTGSVSSSPVSVTVTP